MSAWDVGPWDNDSAADWFGDLMDRTHLIARIDEALQLDPRRDHEEIRAAASVLIMLGRTYVWNIHALDRQLKLAIERLELIASSGVYDEHYQTAIRREIALLAARLERRAPPDDEATRAWWLGLR